MGKERLHNDMLEVWPSVFCADGDNIWFVQSEINCLMKYDMLARQFEAVHQFPNTRRSDMKPYVAMVCVENKIFLVPAFESNLFVYDIKSNDTWEVEVCKEEGCHGPLFVGAHLAGSWLWCVPDCNKGLVRVNTKTLEVQDDLILTDKLGEELGIENVWANRTYVYDNKIWGTTSNSNVVFSFGLDSKEIAIKRLGLPDNKFSSLAIIESELFLYDKTSKKIHKYLLEEELREDGCMQMPQEYAYRIGKLGNFLIADAADAGNFYIYDTDFHLMVEHIWDGKKSRPYSDDNLYLGQMDSNSEKAYYYNSFNNKLYLYDNREFVEMLEFCMEFSADFWQYIEAQEIQNEGRILRLSSFLVKAGEKSSRMRTYESKIGKRILGYLK